MTLPDLDYFKRTPETVMRLKRMGSFHPTRLSFMRSLIRQMGRDKWTIARTIWEMDEYGYGQATYTVRTQQHVYTLVAFSKQLDPQDRTDRVIAERWDTTFTLFDGIPDRTDLARLAKCVPLQEAGRCSASELVLSRANKSVRLFEHVVDRLSRGEQPDMERIAEVGYLMRTTAVYGNGKFGVADRNKILNRSEVNGPFRLELLSVYLIRCFTHDLVEHIARQRGGDTSTPLAKRFKKVLGIGNATGLGMAPFLNKHPQLINKWFNARETALARVRAQVTMSPKKIQRFDELLQRAKKHVAEWHTADEEQTRRIGVLAKELELLRAEFERFGECDGLWDKLLGWSEDNVSLETQEMLVSLVLEPYPELVDDLENEMSVEEAMVVKPDMSIRDLISLIEHNYQWALEIDFDQKQSNYWFWYTSEEKLEPRVGARATEPGMDKEMPLSVARDVRRVFDDLALMPDPDYQVGVFLARYPNHRHVVRRIQSLIASPYGEIRDNLLAEDCLPIDILRSKLSFFGAGKFDPKSSRWTRITMYQNAPLPEDLHKPDADDWCFPVIFEPAQ